MEKNKNLELWNKVEKTNPKYTKNAKVGGNKITSISPQFQILNATEQFGIYGEKWGFKNIELDYSITNTPVTLSVQDWHTKQTENIQSILGLVGFKATFFFPNGEFEITNSIKIFTDNKHSKIDDNYAKKVETDALTKALSKLGFNADIFLGRFDDLRYVEEMKTEFNPPPKPKPKTISNEKCKSAVSAMQSFKKSPADIINSLKDYNLTSEQKVSLGKAKSLTDDKFNELLNLFCDNKVDKEFCDSYVFTDNQQKEYESALIDLQTKKS